MLKSFTRIIAICILLCSTATWAQKKPLTVHFYNVDQGLAALVDLPNGQHILVDTGDMPHRMGCNDICPASEARLLANLKKDLAGAPIDLMWITHQHSDHVGGAPHVFDNFKVNAFIDNGRDLTKNAIAKAHEAARKQGTRVFIIDPSYKTIPIADDSFKLTPVVPSVWGKTCTDDANDCSIMLRIDYGQSSILFTGDAESTEESQVDAGGKVTLLQVGHHGSQTSSSPGFLKKLSPAYAVISAGKPHEGLNRTYCHPRASTVRALTAQLGGPTTGKLLSYEPLKCDDKNDAGWINVQSSDNLWSTSRDGDVVLTTTGDGKFVRTNVK